MSLPWWAAVAPVTTELACDGTRHPLRWEAGQLHLDGHEDVEAEGTLGALGAATPACLRLKAAWEAHAGEVSLVTLGRRPGEPDLGIPGGGPPRREPAPPGPGGARTAVDRRREEDARRVALLQIASLPVTFIDRLVLSAFARADERWADDDFRLVHGLRLGAALAARATPALRRFGAGPAGGADVLVHCAPAGPGRGTELVAEHLGSGLLVTARVTFAWVASVWGAGISEPAGRLVLSLTGVGDGGMEVELAAWEATGPASWEAVARPARLVRDADGVLQIAGGGDC